MSVPSLPRHNTAIIMVDPFNDFMSIRGKLWPLLRKVSLKTGIRENLKKIIDLGRQKKLMIAYAPHQHYVPGQFADRKYLHPSHLGIKSLQVFGEGSFGGKFYDSLKPQVGDIISSSHSCSSGFAGTDLDDQLKQHDITHVVIIGYTSNTCVEATTRSAIDLDYHVTLVTDAVASWTPKDHHAAIGVNYKELAHDLVSTKSIINRIQSIG